MNITYFCPQCDTMNRCEVPDDGVVECVQGDFRSRVAEPTAADGSLQCCVICGSGELFVRKDFSQRIGLAIIIVGFLASSVAWFFYMKYLTFAILFATALADVVLYAVMKNLLECYRCRAQYRGVVGLEAFAPFDLEVHERHRQQQARLAEAERAASHAADTASASAASRRDV